MRGKLALLGGTAALAAGVAATIAFASGAVRLHKAALVPNAIAFSTPSRGFLGTGLEGRRPRGTIEVTTNGGRTWRTVLRTARPVVSVSIDSEGDWARFDDGETLHSGNGGKTWAPAIPETPLATPCPPPLDVYVHQVVVTAHHEWALCAGQGSAGEMAKAVYRLEATGWRRVDHGLSPYGYPIGMALADDGFGVIWESRGTLYVTRDGGSHWTGLPHVAVPETDFGESGVALPRGIAFVLLQRADLSGHPDQNERLLKTMDAGRTWRVVHRWR